MPPVRRAEDLSILVAGGAGKHSVFLPGWGSRSVTRKIPMQYTKFEVNEKLNAIDVPCGPILDTSDIIDDAHLHVREMIVDVPHSQRGTFKTVGSPLKLSDSPVEITQSPLLGEHTAAVLREVMGYSADEVEKLRQQGVV